MQTLVMKFGGTSVGMTTGLTQVLSIILHEQERWDRLLVVVSALEGVTDALIEATRLAQLANRRGYRRIVGTLRTRHIALIEHLPLGQNERLALQADIDRLLFDMLDRCQQLSDAPEKAMRAETIDAIIGVGERLSARIVAALLRQNGLRGVAIDGTDLVITDNVYGNAAPNLALTRERITSTLLPMLDRKIIPVITGFIGATAAGKPTTLGRGGSDYTASVLAACADAQEVWIWTDVDGIMSADPRDVEQARVVPALSFSEAAELSNFGARLLHVRMISPLQERSIPLRVRNIFRPQGMGTLISKAVDSRPMLKAVTLINGLGMWSSRSGPPHQVVEAVNDALFSISGTSVEVVFTAQSSWERFVGFIIPTSAGPDAIHALLATVDDSTQVVMHDWRAQPVSIVTVVGTHLDQLRQAIAEVLLAMDNIRLHALSPSPTNASFSLVVPADEGEAALERAHTVVERFSNG